MEVFVGLGENSEPGNGNGVLAAVGFSPTALPRALTTALVHGYSSFQVHGLHNLTIYNSDNPWVRVANTGRGDQSQVVRSTGGLCHQVFF